MSFLNAYDDFVDTLGQVVGPIAKLAYIDSLRSESGVFTHWGLERVHGEACAHAAIEKAAADLAESLLRDPCCQLAMELPMVATQLQQGAEETLAALRMLLTGKMHQMPAHKQAHLRYLLAALESTLTPA